LLLPFRGKTVLETTVETVLEIPFREVVVVTGHDRAAVEALLESHPVRVVHNSRYPEGMGASLRVGVAAAEGSAGVMILPGDMPLIRRETLLALCRAFAGATLSAPIVVPVHGGRRGNPVVFSPEYREALLGISGDRGAKAILRAHPRAVVEVEVDDPGIFIDVDTPEDYHALE
ncbi:MAG: nucleotidyltransferase family protein, partial [Calditrichaeota bacterium]